MTFLLTTPTALERLESAYVRPVGRQNSRRNLAGTWPNPLKQVFGHALARFGPKYHNIARARPTRAKFDPFRAYSANFYRLRPMLARKKAWTVFVQLRGEFDEHQTNPKPTKSGHVQPKSAKAGPGSAKFGPMPNGYRPSSCHPGRRSTDHPGSCTDQQSADRCAPPEFSDVKPISCMPASQPMLNNKACLPKAWA